MHGEDHRLLSLDDLQRVEQPGENLRVVDVGGPMQREHREALDLQPQLFEDGRLGEARLVLQQGVDHHVADEVDL